MGTRSVRDVESATSYREHEAESMIVVDDEIRVLLIGDEGLERDGLAEALNGRDDMAVTAAVEHEDGLLAAATAEANVAVVFYETPSHMRLCRRLATHRTRMGVVVADSFLSAQDLEALRGSEVTGFVHRDSPVSTLVGAIHAVAAGREFRDARIPPEPLETYGLTDRELEVLSTLWPGCTNVEVARRLHLSEDAVKYHLKNIYLKLGIHSREEALAFAQYHGIVKYHPPRRKP